MVKQELEEKVSVGGGHTGKSEVPDPVGGTATLPASKKQGDSMPKIDDKGTAAVTSTDTETNVEPTDVSAERNRASIKSKIGALSTKAEDLNAIFGGENLSEEFITKAGVVYEAAVKTAVEKIVTEIQEEISAEAEAKVAEAVETLAAELNEALDFAVQKWLEENEVPIVSNLRANIAEDLLTGIKKVFDENYVQVPEDRVDIVDQLVNHVAELEEQFNTATNTAIELQKKLNEHARAAAMAEASAGLTATQVEKLNALAESVEFDTVESFSKKIGMLKESYFSNKADAGKTSHSMLTEASGSEDEQSGDVKPSTDPIMGRYVDAIARTIVNDKVF